MKKQFYEVYGYPNEFGTPSIPPENMEILRKLKLTPERISIMDADIAILRDADIQAVISDILDSDKIGTRVSDEVREFINKYMAEITKYLYDKYNRQYENEILEEIYKLFENNEFDVDEGPRLLFPSQYRNLKNEAFIVFAFGHKRKTFDHEGLDIRAPMHTRIWACADGEVVKVVTKDKGAYGKYVKIKHVFSGEIYFTYYAHLNSATVSVGDTVLAGQMIAWSGNSGNSLGPHLHLTLVKQDDPSTVRGVNLKGVIDPEQYMYTNDDVEIKVIFR